MVIIQLSATIFNITEKNVEKIIAAGRARFKIKNENNNVLKTKGDNLEHNFGHNNVSMVFITLNI